MVTRLIVTVVKGRPVRMVIDAVAGDGSRSILQVPRDLYDSDQDFYEAVRLACLDRGAPDVKYKPGQ